MNSLQAVHFFIPSIQSFCIAFFKLLFSLSISLDFSSSKLLSSKSVCSFFFFSFFYASSYSTNLSKLVWSFVSILWLWSKACFLASFFLFKSVISFFTQILASSALNISFFQSMNSCMFQALQSLGNYTLLLAICMAEDIRPFCSKLKLDMLSSVAAGGISGSLTRLRGALVVAVFLSQIYRFLAASFTSFFFAFSVSLVTNTSSSSGGLNGERGLVEAPLICDIQKSLSSASKPIVAFIFFY